MVTRTVAALPTRNPKNRPKTLPVSIQRHGIRSLVNINPSDHPFFVALPVFRRVGLLASTPPETSFPGTSRAFIMRGKDAFFKQDGDSFSFTIHPGAISRLVAKIAHAYVWAKRGFDNIYPLLIPLILGSVEHSTYFVGCETEEFPFTPENLHTLSTYEITIGGCEYICARVQLFSYFGMPVYDVVVGILAKDLPSAPKAP
jgi:hypothetical protein